ncbi:MAG TPA: barstar family protein [Gemmatimonadales bacterium]|nr:barstar family protein [Gemmatimonadales bacterium]
MERVSLDGRKWRAPEDFYRALLAALGAPEWHGHNLDALEESLRDGDINHLNPPLALQVIGVDDMTPEARLMVQRFHKLVEDLRTSGVLVSLDLT